MFSIRPAISNDQSAIVDIWHDGWHDAHAKLVPDDILEFRTAECFWLWLECSTDQFHVAVDNVDNSVVGFVATNGPELVKLYVAANARGTGIATELLSHAEVKILGSGISDAVLFCTAGNTRAQKFYDREAWTLSNTFADHLWLPKNAIGEFLVDTHCYKKHLI